MKNMFNVTTVLPHNLLQTNPSIRHNFSTQVFWKRAAQLHYVGPELRYIFWLSEVVSKYLDKIIYTSTWLGHNTFLCSTGTYATHTRATSGQVRHA